MTGPMTPPSATGPSTGELRALRMTAQRLAGLIAAGDTDAVRTAVEGQPRLLTTTVERTDQGGWAPLHLAVAAGSRELVEVLVAAGAELEARTEHGRTPLHLALEFAPDLVAVLQSLGAEVDPAAAAFTGNTDRLRAALDAGEPLVDAHTEVPLLSWAAFGGSLDTLGLLLGRGADPRGGALLAAARAGRPAAVTRLLEAGADVDHHDQDTGRTALHTAVTAGPAGAGLEVVELLLAAGADVETTTSDGASSLDIARVAAARARAGTDGSSTPHDALVDLLEQYGRGT